MDVRSMTTASNLSPAAEDGKQVHPVMALIASTWTNFAAGKKAEQKRQIILAWESALSDIPIGVQLEAIKRKAKENHVWPPSSPAEVRDWCNEVQKPMNGMDILCYQTAKEEDLIDRDFCQRQIDKYNKAKAENKVTYAGWD